MYYHLMVVTAATSAGAGQRRPSLLVAIKATNKDAVN